MKTVGYYYTDEVVCVPCHKHFVGEVADAIAFGEDARDLWEQLDKAEPATFIGLPDGFTCTECADVITDKGDK
jgi:hypothetical protein